MTILLLFASTHGHTAKIAERMGVAVRAAGRKIDIHNAAQGETPDPAQYDGVIVGASLHRGLHQPEVVDWVKAHRPALEGRPSAFFSVSLTAAEDTEEAREATQGCIDDFVEDTGWTPGRTASIAGALQYREYDVFTRTLIRLMMRRGGHPTDTSQDYDYTDWDAVEEFAREFATQVQGGQGDDAR